MSAQWRLPHGGPKPVRARMGAPFLGVMLLLGAMGAHAAEEGRAYPAPGTPVPEAPCARADAPAWVGFFCRFMTLERWLQAGRPDFIDAGGKRWQPWFYGREGLTNQLLIEGREYQPEREGWFEALFDVGNFEAETYSYFWDLFRYAPWSVQFQHAGGCTGQRVLNPHALRAAPFRRAHILGLGWAGIGDDPADPSRSFEAAAAPVLLGFAQFRYALEPALRAQLVDNTMVRAEINAMAEGQGRLWPDFDRDGGVWLIAKDGTVSALDDLDTAAARWVETGLMVTTDAMRSWDSGYRAAAEIARARGPLLYLYFAQDAFTPMDPAGVYIRRLAYLVDRAAGLAGGNGAGLQVMSHGRSAGAVARAVAGHEAIVHRAYAPFGSPLDAGVFADALMDAENKARIEVVARGLPALTAQPPAGAIPACLGD